MRVLAHIHTFNDADIIDRTIAAVLRQTRPVDEVLVVDNGSSDNTLDQPSLRYATVLRHRENLGTSSSVRTSTRTVFRSPTRSRSCLASLPTGRRTSARRPPVSPACRSIR